MKEINNEIESTEDPKTKATLLNERGSLNRKVHLELIDNTSITILQFIL